MQKTRRRFRRRRALYPDVLPSYLLPPHVDQVVFDPSLQRAGDCGRH